MLNIKRIDHVLNTIVYIAWLTLCLWFTWFMVRHHQRKSLGYTECQRKSLLEDMLCTSQPLVTEDVVDHVLHTLPMYKDYLGIMKEQYTINSGAIHGWFLDNIELQLHQIRLIYDTVIYNHSNCVGEMIIEGDHTTSDVYQYVHAFY